MEGRRGLQAIRTRRAIADGHTGRRNGNGQPVAPGFSSPTDAADAAKPSGTTDAAYAPESARTIWPGPDAAIGFHRLVVAEGRALVRKRGLLFIRSAKDAICGNKAINGENVAATY